MKILVLGSAAGGGFPQWNCHCANCKGLREGTIKATPRTQSSIAVSLDGKDWVLINASPDLRQQINQSPQLWPENQTRGTNIRGVLLCDSQVDHTTGLLTLREGLPLDVYCTKEVHQDLSTTYPLFNMLSHWHGGLSYKTIGTDHTQAFTVTGVSGLSFYPVVLESNAPPYSTYRDAVVDGNNIGLKIVDEKTGKWLFYAPGIVETNPLVEQMLDGASCALIDGTLWLDDEMISQGVGEKLGSEMGHMPVNGEFGSVSLLNRFNIDRKILIHINNTNPILNEDSKAHQYVIENGVEIATDGLEITI
ncbi:pyrroloquinoline quinone biosynthesis protein PqqB [Psychrobium sp. 1_MG-2023]|uniref:pyrroloquinoline quinone biosynthesis protein PqqB n=1 Tax=Psychrobium sp. 1_MG-2023 TaxID=3062624 RepID=UPI000C321A0E|nr:pyrroloquinoline quinone biosynthesis protein PqqB [Psychrobium sp. 1_MG-2023]MDP2561570.1 pyrroloquinoline quinone biosynthesis protein PqqB [Psychrobium sp. 1_MG-2023]PKF55031.1 pyrroloquinoline quinone biosynthesis protein PqqB [Alteromonadales bacterium alter-6D02]